MRKAQVSMEFVLLMSFMILAFTVVFVVVQQKASEIQNNITGNQAEEISNIMKNEVEMAHLATNGYKREFWIPDYINGEPYTLKINDYSEMVINYKDQTYVLFLVTNITGGIAGQKGYHIIEKNGGNITITPGRL